MVLYIKSLLIDNFLSTKYFKSGEYQFKVRLCKFSAQRHIMRLGSSSGAPQITKVNYFDNTLYARGYILIWTNSAVFRFRATQTRWKYLPKIERRASAVFKCLCHVPLYAKRYKWTHGIKCTKGPAKRASRRSCVQRRRGRCSLSARRKCQSNVGSLYRWTEKVSSWLTNTFDMKIQNWKKSQ